MSDAALHKLAALYGITLALDSGVLQQFEDEDQYLVDILQAAGLPIVSASEAEAILRRFLRTRRQQILEPVRIVSENDTPFLVPIRLSETDECQYRWELTGECGQRHSGTFAVPDLRAFKPAAFPDFYDFPYVLELKVAIPIGYHQLTIYLADRPEDEIVASMMLIITPDSCYVPPGIAEEGRVWGLSAYLHALRSRSSWGIGDFSDLKHVLSWGAAQGAGLVHTQPLHALDVSWSGTPNPYSPSSRSHLNGLFVDIEAIPECAESEDVQKLINDARYQARLVYLRNQDQIDYEGVCRIKDEALRGLWKHFTVNHLNPASSRGEAFRRFQREGGTTLRFFSLYLAILEKFSVDEFSRSGWPSWLEPFRNPDSEDVAEFAQSHEYEIEYHQYVQWQAATQLAAIGRRSMELGLKVGLVAEFPYGHAANGFESWYYQDLLLAGALLDRQQQNLSVVDPAEGQTPVIASRLLERCYQPLIEGLRHTMLQAGAVVIRSVGNYFQASFSLAGQEVKRMAVMRYAAGDLLGIIALESRRNRCLVIADHLDLLVEEQQEELRCRNILSYNVLLQTHRGWYTEPITTNYMPMSVVSSSAPFLAAMKGLWKGLDISVKTAARIFRSAADKEAAILARAADRARFLINMDHEGLLPDGCGLDQAAFPEIDQSLISATQVLLARCPAKILLVTLDDLLGNALQATPPAMDDQTFWRGRYAKDLESIIAGKEIETVLLALCRERGLGVVRPSASAPDRRKRQGLRVPSCFYRLQLHKGFTFLQAAEIMPYLKMLGVSHCYVSPFLMARPGSPHGYDIINHCCLNPEIGSREDFERMIAVLDENKMALLLDIVPNHMGVGSDNQWWMDVLENGEASAFHQTNMARMYHWPNSMVSSSTHDSKRSEDVRARMNVLTEMVPQWRQRVINWSKRNHHLKTELDNLLAPSRNDEYALYQNLLGAWPISPHDESEHQFFVKRMVDATIKGCREAKRHTSWVSPNTAYERAVIRFVEGILSTSSNVFLTDFIQFHKKIAWFGMFNSISQLFLKLVVPGIPDIYQGNEIWRFCLVDPDNRRAVDFQKRQAMLMAMSDRIREVGDNITEFHLEVLHNVADGRAKMYTVMRIMAFRNSWPDVFARGSYLPLAVTGSNSRHICAFARIRGGQVVIAIAPRLYLTLMRGKTDLPLGEEVWGDTQVLLPVHMTGIACENIYSPWAGDAGGADIDTGVIRVGHVLQSWPVALLKGTFQN